MRLFGSRERHGTRENMSDTLGCFGKLKFEEIDELQRCFAESENYWVDAVPFRNDGDGVCSIDTVVLDPLQMSASVAIAILHAVNDIYAARSRPTSISVSLTVPTSFDVNALHEIGATIKSCAEQINCTIGKLHTSRSDCPPTLTACAIGSSPIASLALAPQGVVWLLDELSDPWEAIKTFDFLALEPRIFMREFAANRKGVQLKDVSGDGLAGTLYQLCLRHRLSINLNKNFLLSLVNQSALDACNRDKKVCGLFTSY